MCNIILQSFTQSFGASDHRFPNHSLIHSLTPTYTVTKMNTPAEQKPTKDNKVSTAPPKQNDDGKEKTMTMLAQQQMDLENMDKKKESPRGRPWANRRSWPSV